MIGEEIIQYKTFKVSKQGNFIEIAKQQIPLKNLNGYQMLITHGASGLPNYIPSVKNPADGSPAGIISATYSRKQGMMAYVYDYGMRKFSISLYKESNFNLQGEFWFKVDSSTLYPNVLCFFEDSQNSISLIYTATSSKRTGPVMKVIRIGSKKEVNFLGF